MKETELTRQQLIELALHHILRAHHEMNQQRFDDAYETLNSAIDNLWEALK